MKDRFGWGMRQNFALAAAQGLAYVPGALSAGRLTKWLGRGNALAIAYSLLTALSIVAWRLASAGQDASATAVAGVILCYTFVIGTSWPILESLVASGEPIGLARRLAAYNVVWPAAGAVAIAIEGTLIKYWGQNVFLLPAILHGVALFLVATKLRTLHQHQDASSPIVQAHVAPEPELLHKRKLALWLSRAALPATYTVIYGLMPLMPFLGVMKGLSTSTQTAVASVWLFARWAAFATLALGTWWHTRPRMLLWAAVAMLVAFFGMTLPPTHGRLPAVDLACMIGWQAVLGAALGMIYSASLYFGMVLSEGSTEHGGYHEALIGLGWVLGPGAGVIAERLKPGESWVGVAAVGTVIALSVLVVLTTAVVMGRVSATIEDE
jgi:MFS family permease